MQTDNTLLDDVEVEMLVVLRMNNAFMEFMRLHYADVGREQLGMQVVCDILSLFYILSFGES